MVDRLTSRFIGENGVIKMPTASVLQCEMDRKRGVHECVRVGTDGCGHVH